MLGIFGERKASLVFSFRRKINNSFLEMEVLKEVLFNGLLSLGRRLLDIVAFRTLRLSNLYRFVLFLGVSNCGTAGEDNMLFHYLARGRYLEKSFTVTLVKVTISISLQVKSVLNHKSRFLRLQ